MIKKIIIAAIISLGFTVLYGQETYKESKYFTKELSLKPGEKIQITGERTFIYITEWDKEIVEAEVEVISRYSEKRQAQNDLEKIKVRFEKKRSTLYYSNALNIGDAENKPKSSLKTILRLSVPSYALIEINNVFGELNVVGSVEELSCNSQFGATTISNCTGQLSINSKYGKIKCEDTSGSLEVIGNKSDLSLLRVGGEVNASLNYGNLDIHFSEAVVAYDLTTMYSPVTLIVPNDSKNTMEISFFICDVNIDNCNIVVEEKIAKKKHIVKISDNDKTSGIVKLSSQHEDVTIITTDSISKSN